ncbi:unnamed protein product [Prorocentrum cordatum]|uniref:AP2/ERF domain-containing protein n=1 Tax=Prorocentrum cordatum TaxID=2364126 RepID=A0ABN9RU37_9DINO|nr:unnamed protein product [Polarella glacialis]
MKQLTFRPKDESPEEVEQARLAAVEALRRLEDEDRAFGPISLGRRSAERQSGVESVSCVSKKQAWRVRYVMENGPGKGTKKQLTFRPKDESPEEVERARLAAVEALRRLEEEDRALGPISLGRKSAERQSGVKYVNWVSKKQTWGVRYVMKNGPGKGSMKQLTFRPKDESPEEVERARLAAVEALRRLEEEDRAPGPVSSGQHSAERQSGVEYIHWNRTRQAWSVDYHMQSGKNQGTTKQLTFRPKDESPEEVERARLAAVEALRRLEEEDRALGPRCGGWGRRTSSGEPAVAVTTGWSVKAVSRTYTGSKTDRRGVLSTRCGMAQTKAP